VAADPDGTFTFTSNAQPARALKNGAWTPIDTTLIRNADGTYSPAVADDGAVFSGGGRRPLVSLTDPGTGKSVALCWPNALPAPAVSGDAALYPNVLPGVDLRLEASATGYSEVLIVRDAAAAADPGLRKLQFTVSASTGVKLSTRADGGLSATVAATGATLFSGGDPLMWDSGRHGPIPETPGPDQPGSGRVTAVPATAAPITAGADAGGQTLTLAPPASALAGPGVHYPLYVDPEMNGGRQYYSEVASFGRNWNTTTNTTSVGSGIVELGYCGYSSCGYTWNGAFYSTYDFRDYFQMDTSALAPRNGLKANIHSSIFNIEQTGNSNDCTAQPTNLYSAGAIGSGTSYPGPLGTYQSQVKSNAGGGSSCAAANDAFDALAFTQSANGATNLTFGLAAPDANDEYEYKTFSDNPSLTVVYNFAPLAPDNLAAVGAVACASTTYVSAADPQLSARGTDNNPSQLDLKLNFDLENSSGTSTVESGTSSEIASGGTASWTAPTALTSGTAYEFRASATNVVPAGTGNAPALTGPESGWYGFTSLSALPSAAPTIAGYDYPPAQWGQATGSPGIFTVGTGGAANIAGFAYSFDGGSGSEPLPATGDCAYQNDGGVGTSMSANGFGNGSGELELVGGSAAQIRIPAGMTVGRHTLYVRSFDFAHNASAESAYQFYVPADYQTASQPSTIIGGDTLVKTVTGANASEVATQSACCNVTWHDGSQLFFNNTTQNDTFTVSFNVPDAGTWQLGADMTTASDYGRLSVALDGSTSLAGTAATPWDGYTPIVSLHYLDLGTPHLTAGTHTLTFTAVGKNAASTAYRAGIDFLELNPTNRYEAEGLGYTAPTAGSLSVQNFSGNPWSEGAQLFLYNTAANTSFTVAFNAPVESDFALGVNLTEAADYGTLRFDLDPATANVNLHNTASAPIDAYAPSVTTQYLLLGGVHLTAGSHVLKVTVVGANSAAVNNKYNAGLDYIEAAPVTGATDASFTAAMNNRGFIGDNAASPIQSLDQIGDNISLSTLQAAGLTAGSTTAPGATFMLGGATFTMPQLQANSGGGVAADNVVADGQTIALPAVNATGVALLAVSTCGTSPARNVTISYASGGPQPSQPAFAAVPDWNNGSRNNAAVVLGYRDDGVNGAVPDTAKKPLLYEIVLPANPNGTLSSITLPTFSPTYLSGSCDAALHIIAIGTRTTPAVPSADGGGAWVGAYAAPMDQAITPANGSVSNETLREEVAVSVPGSGYVRLHLSNAHSSAPVLFDSVTIAAQSSGQSTVALPGAVDFSGSPSVTIPAGGDVYSDPVQTPSTAGGSGELTVSLHIASTDTVTQVPIHDSTTAVTNYASGNVTANQDGSPFTSANSLAGLYYLAAVDASDTNASDGTVEVLGDQTATQAPAWTTNTWPAALPAALTADSVALPGAVANASTSGPAPAAHSWHLAEGGGATGYDAGSGYDNLTTANSPAWSSDNPGSGTSTGSLSLNGTNQYAASSTPALNTANSFSVSAWVKLASTAHNQVVAAQDGSTESGFYLGYLTNSSGGAWTMYFMTADTTSPSWQPEVSVGGVTANAWTHLVGVYNASTKTAQLFVNGVMAGSATGITTWNATGAFTVGRDLYNGGQADYFDGEITDVRAWNTALYGTQASEVYTDGGASTLTTANALAAFDQTASQEPNIRDVVLSVGANDVLDGASVPAMQSNITALVNGVAGQYTNNVSGRTVQVFVDTVLPLGLPATDARERNREQINSWITSTYQGGQGIDIAAAVADPSNVNQIASTYLTGGVPKSSYYTQIAQTVAQTIENALPPISLARRPS
jgi:hypothetical protein